VEKFREPFLAENPVKFPYDTYNSLSSITIFPKMKIFFLKTTLRIGENVLFGPQTSHIFIF
jgi:hypothetical protein